MKKLLPKEAQNSSPTDVPNKTVPVDKVFTESTVMGGGIIITS
jgi:hypothetical protein